jgi:hypothetical protein
MKPVTQILHDLREAKADTPLRVVLKAHALGIDVHDMIVVQGKSVKSMEEVLTNATQTQE